MVNGSKLLQYVREKKEKKQSLCRSEVVGV